MAICLQESSLQVPLKAKCYILFVVIAGWAAVLVQVARWTPVSWVDFGLYFCVSLIASGFKVRLPGITGTLSACFFLVLIGIVSRSVPETLLSGCGAVLVQCLWHSRLKSKLVRAAFNAGAVALAITASAALFHSALLRSLHLEFATLLLIVGCTYFLANTLPVAAIISLTENSSIWTVWRKGYFWSFPHYLVGAAAAGFFQMAMERLGWQTAMLIAPVVLVIYRSYSAHVGRLEDARLHAEESAGMHFRTVESLALAIEAKDQTTHDHLQRVQVYAMEIGKELRVGESEMAALRAASLLHDIGKIAVPEHILNKPGKLTREEFQKMKVHPVVGAEILERAHFPFPVAPIVRCHHEKWDGAGYPAGLKGEAIPIGARILAAVDCFDALASDRQYRRALPLDEAMAAVERESGRSFDPRVVEVLKRRYIDLEHMARSTHFDPFRLSTDIHIENGDAPAAGFASTGETEAGASHAPAPGSASDWTRLESLLTRAHSSEPTLTMDETLGLFAARLAKNITFDDLAIYVRQNDVLVTAFVTGKHRPAIEPLRIPLGQGVTGWAAQASRSILNGNPAVEPGWTESGTLLSALAIPLETSAGSVGVLTLYGAAENGFRSDDLKFLGRLTSALSSFVEGNTLAASSSPARVAASSALLSDRALQHV